MGAEMARYLGAISGTSLDGIDLALVEIASPDGIRISAGATVPFEITLRKTLRAIALGEINDIDALGHADVAMGHAIAEAALRFLEDSGLKPEQIRAFGSHGQTVRHRPEGDNAFTLQIGDPNVIAELTGITTVADFRRRDMAAGGQAAPLVPVFHEALFADTKETRTVLNIGGIANITTLIPGVAPGGFDTGPGNALLDAWVQKHLNRNYDADGAWQRTGRPDPELLARFLEDTYFADPPPKSTGKEHFNLSWIDCHTGAQAPADVQATLAELTAVSVTRALSRWGTDTGPVIACGGGRLNSALMASLDRHIGDARLCSSETMGVNGDWLEAAAFAYLAHRRLEGLPGNVPAVTGAAGERILGAVYPR